MSFPQTRRFWAQLGAADGGDPGDGPQDDATQPQRLFAKSEFFGRPLPSEAIAALVATFSEGRAAGQYRELDFMPWGGPTTVCRPRPPPSFLAPSCSSSSTRLWSTPPVCPAAESAAAHQWVARSWGVRAPVG